MRIVCQQLAPTVGDLSANQVTTVAAIREGVDLGADLVVLPELVTSGYVFASRDEAARVAVTTEHALFTAWAEAAAGALVVAGFCEQGDDGHLYNSAVVVDGGGVRAVYRKTHLWDREKLIFTAGSQPPPILETGHGRLGILVCYDLEFPELTRTLALRGAEVVVVPTNWPLVPRPRSERPPEVLIAMATARVNRMFVACCDRVGTERGQEWTGGTSVIDEHGWVLASSYAAGPVVADVDLMRARTKASSPRNDALADRRPELYGAVTDAAAEATLGDDASSRPVATDRSLPFGGREVGTAEPLVLLPGMLGDADVWADAAVSLADERPVQVARIDLDASVTEAAASVLAVAPPRFALAGHSLGGIVALEILRQAPDRVGRLALFNTSARSGSAAQLSSWSELRERIQNGDFPAVARELVLQTLPVARQDDTDLVTRGMRSASTVGPDGLQRQLLAQATRPDSRPFLPAIHVPTIVVTGGDDEVCPATMQEEIATGIPGAVHRTLEGVGHMAPIEAPEATAAVLAEWLD